MDWVILELTSRGEQDDPDLVRTTISKALKGVEVFIPSVVTQVGDDRVIHRLMDGYAFARMNRTPVEYFRLEGSKYIQSVLVNPGSGSRYRRVSTIKDRDIVKMQDQIRQLTDQGIGIGDTVKITSGPYRDLQASVVEEIPETGMVQVFIRMLSKESLLMLPRSFLVIVERAPFSLIGNRLKALLEWTQRVRPLLVWNLDPNLIKVPYDRYSRVCEWDAQLAHFSAIEAFDHNGLDWGTLQSKFEEYSRVDRWLSEGLQLYSFLAAFHDKNWIRRSDQVQSTFQKLCVVEDFLDRIRSLWEEVDSLGRSMAQREGLGLVENVIIDGHNLAFRCFYAPGLNTLKDRQGRPTGMVKGFLDSLKSLHKKYPEASLHVTWDGSSQRRKRKFGEYKANRPAHAINSSEWNPFKYLQEILPLFGIRQVWNPEEEADDVIATLVRGPLKGQNNLILSTDKDLLQLITPTDSVLYPAVGSRNEILFDLDSVTEIMGVAPEKIVQLRALYGDTSDNIPGVPRVPKKVLRALIQAYGSIGGIYKSGLSGLSKGQYERLRSAEPQVKINVELMTLVDVSLTTVIPDVDPNTASAKLRELDIDPQPLCNVFFSKHVDQTSDDVTLE